MPAFIEGKDGRFCNPSKKTMIILAKNAGFCYGVKKAVDTVYSLIEKHGGESIYTIGKLIHNDGIINELSRRGVNCLSGEGDELENQLTALAENAEKDCFIVIRAHGIPLATKNLLEECHRKNSRINIVDCTCPRVVKVQKIVEENTRNGETAVIIGDGNHPEVKGIAGYAHNKCEIYSGEADLKAAIGEKKTDLVGFNKKVIVSQTTFNTKVWKNLQFFFNKYCTNALIYDTICNVTENRQNEAAKIAEKADLMLVVGGRESSNTNKLCAIATEVMAKRGIYASAFLIENKADLGNISLTGKKFIGITAGASTPDSSIMEVFNTMTDIEKNVSEIQGEDFEQLLKEHTQQKIYTGATVKGIITSVTPNELQVDLGTKVTGILPYSEISDETAANLTENYKVGDEITAKVIKVSDLDGVATLSRKSIESVLKWQKIVDAKNADATLIGKYLDPVKGGILIEIEGQRIFVPGNHTGTTKDTDLATLTGKEAQVKIIEIDEERKRAVASARVVLRAEKKAKEAAFWDSIEAGQEIEGVVKSIVDFGAFIDLGGFDGLLHVTEMSWKRIKHPSEILAVGDKITVFIKKVNKEEHQISLTCKTEATNPWNVFTTKYSIGDVVKVKIASIMTFGAFAEIVPGCDGLIHISQIADHKVASVAEELKIGEEVDAKIVDIDFEAKRISLSITALLEKEEPEEETAEDEAPDEE